MAAIRRKAVGITVFWQSPLIGEAVEEHFFVVVLRILAAWLSGLKFWLGGWPSDRFFAMCGP